jgi:predicted transcriptional regulator
MHFDRYYYPALELINKNKYPLRLNQIALTDLDSSYLKSIYDELISEGYCEINDSFEFISLTAKGNQYLIDNNPNPENKELYIRILEFLNDNAVYGQKLEFVSHILHEVATHEERLKMVKVIRQLKKDGYIDYLDDSENTLCGRSGGRYTPVTQTGIRASITDKGREFLKPKIPVPTHHIHMENVTNPILNSTIQDSLLSIKTTDSNNIQAKSPIIKKPKPLLITIIKYIIGILAFIGTYGA